MYIGVLTVDGTVVFVDKLPADSLHQAKHRIDGTRQIYGDWSYHDGDVCQVWKDGEQMAGYTDEETASWWDTDKE